MLIKFIPPVYDDLGEWYIVVLSTSEEIFEIRDVQILIFFAPPWDDGNDQSFLGFTPSDERG